MWQSDDGREYINTGWRPLAGAAGSLQAQLSFIMHYNQAACVSAYWVGRSSYHNLEHQLLVDIKFKATSDVLTTLADIGQYTYTVHTMCAVVDHVMSSHWLYYDYIQVQQSPIRSVYFNFYGCLAYWNGYTPRLSIKDGEESFLSMLHAQEAVFVLLQKVYIQYAYCSVFTSSHWRSRTNLAVSSQNNRTRVLLSYMTKSCILPLRLMKRRTFITLTKANHATHVLLCALFG